MQFRLYSVIFFIYDKKNNVSVRIGGVLYGYTVVLDDGVIPEERFWIME